VGSSGILTLDLPVLPRGRIVCYDRISATDWTSSQTYVYIGYKQGSNETIIYGAATPTAQVPYGIDTRVFLAPEYRVFARFVGATDADEVQLTAVGYVAELVE
jgi:hypothetical protein